MIDLVVQVILFSLFCIYKMQKQEKKTIMKVWNVVHNQVVYIEGWNQNRL